MTADDGRPENQWPVPPPWMWGCPECVRLYHRMKRVQEETDERRRSGDRGVDHDPLDSMIGSRIRLARHLVTGHREHLPDWTPGCERCAWHHRILDAGPEPHHPGGAAAMVAAEHRAFHLFVPPRVVGLM
ncbi:MULTISPECIES: hypothetical protein [Embleya]|uniref:Uncharacterized protein n=1 Tax=Embleya hyalina TaxID=516124 RepID=A0A401YU60_9ACTN|nr:hypothetical protein [Embleya hyalina]GCD98085.1 hypothetical protein EHYA_05785 [Embleya hyalina]